MDCRSKKLIFLSIFVLFFISFSYATYPSFEFISQNFPAGQVDISGKSSSGSQVELFVNGLTIGTQDVIANETIVILDGSSIQNQVLPYGSTIIFRNEGPRNYQLNISGVYKELSFGEELTYLGSTIGDIMFTDNTEGINRIISVVDTLVDFEFEYVNDYLENGNNNLRFVQKYPFLTYTNQSEFEYTFNFEKYVNDITVTNFTNITNQNSANIQGFVESVSYPAFYLVNINPDELGNIGALNTLDLVGDRFNLTVDNLQEGENKIYLITVDPNNQNIFTGVQRVEVLVDTQPPYLDINRVTYEKSGDVYRVDFGSEIFLNGNRLTLEIETDAVILNYTFNNESYSQDVINNSVNITLNLDDGLNPLILEPIDIAGNKIKQSHNIYFDDTNPDIIKESLTPEEMFDNGVARFFFQNIEGKTNKPEVSLTIFTLPNNAETLDGTNVDCDNYEDLFIRNLGQLDRERVDGPELNLNETQISLTNFIFQRTTVTSDSDGNFEALIGLQEKNFGRSEYNDMNDDNSKKSPEVNEVDSRNKICFVMSDKYGNFDIHQESVTLDAGNTMWDPQDITTVPNTVYAAEIEDSGDERTGRANTEVGVIARFQYIGGGEVTNLNYFSIKEDFRAVGRGENSYQVDRSRMNFMLDKDTGEMTVYFPVIIKPLDIKPLDYPGSIDLAFQADVRYTVDDIDIPIDTVNPIYFKTAVNVESPLDHAKWLTPEMIDNWLEFLEQSIAFTEQAVEYTQLASIFGVLTCTGAKFWHAYEVALIKSECTDESGGCSDQIQKINRKLYLICDRIACTGAPPRCDDDTKTLENMFGGISSQEVCPDGKQNCDKKITTLVDKDNKPINQRSELPLDPAQSQLTDSQDNVLGKIDEVKFLGDCATDTGEEGYLIEVESNAYDKNSSLFSNGFFGYKRIDSKWEGTQCIAKNQWNQRGASTLGGGGVCFSTLDPFYDDTRCNFFGLDGTEGSDSDGVDDRDPASSILSSVRCGCITDTYSHLRNYLKIQQAIKGCLEQAKIGETKGSYCERLMGIAVCDIATNIVLPEVMKAYRNAPGVEAGDTGRQFDFITQMKKTEKAMNGRYDGTVLSRSGLQTSQIVNKACLGAITGDWSALTDNILSSLDQNEVEPIFGPLMPESRIQGYNPITGELSIQYRLTYAVVSGGQRIRSEIYLICDPSAANGEYCPSSYEETDQIGGKTITPLFVRAGGSAQDTVVLTDPQAKFWYNKIRIVHKYEVKGKEQTKTEEFSILHKGEVVPQCHFSVGMSSGAGFVCDTIFADDALLSRFVIEDGTRFTPDKVFYEGSVLRLFLKYDVRGDGTQNSFDLHYITECNGLEGGSKVYAGGIEPIVNNWDKANENKDITNPIGYSLINLFDNKPIEKLNIGSSNDNIIVGSSQDMLKNGTEYTIVFSNLDIDVRKDIEIIVEDEEYFSQTYKPNSFILNASSLNNESFQEVKFILKQNLSFSDLEIRLNKPLTNVKVTLKEINKDFSLPQEEVEGTISDVFKDVVEGQCKLYARILPSEIARFTSLEEFMDYNPAGEDIQTNLNEKDVKEFDFRVMKETKASQTTKISTDLVLPVEKASYCFKKGFTSENRDLYGQSFDLNIITQSSDRNIANKNLKVSIEALSSEVLGSLMVGDNALKSDIQKDNFWLSNFVGALDLEEIYDKLESNGMNKLEVKLRVEITDEEKKAYSKVEERTLVFTHCGEELILPQIPEVFSTLQSWINKLKDKEIKENFDNLDRENY